MRIGKAIKRIRKFFKRTWFLWLPGLTLWWHWSNFHDFSIPQQTQFAFAFQVTGGLIILFSLNGSLKLINQVSYWELFTGMRSPWKNWKLGRPVDDGDQPDFMKELDATLDRLKPKLDEMRAARMGGGRELALLEIRLNDYVDKRVREVAMKANLQFNRVDKLALGGIQSQLCGAIFGIYGTLVATALG